MSNVIVDRYLPHKFGDDWIGGLTERALYG